MIRSLNMTLCSFEALVVLAQYCNTISLRDTRVCCYGRIFRGVGKSLKWVMCRVVKLLLAKHLRVRTTVSRENHGWLAHARTFSESLTRTHSTVLLTT